MARHYRTSINLMFVLIYQAKNITVKSLFQRQNKAIIVRIKPLTIVANISSSEFHEPLLNDHSIFEFLYNQKGALDHDI